MTPTCVRHMEIVERIRQGVSTKPSSAKLLPKYSMRAVVSSGYCQAGGSARRIQLNTAGGDSSRRDRAEITEYKHLSSFARSRKAQSSSPWLARGFRSIVTTHADFGAPVRSNSVIQDRLSLRH